MDQAIEQEGQQGFEAVYSEFVGRLRCVAISRGVPPSEAEELVHDVFFTFLVQQPNVRLVERYLVAGVCNASRDYWRRKGTEAAGQDFVANLKQGDAATVEDEVAFRTTVSVMLAQLSGRCRDTFRRFYLDGESAAQIAVALNTTEAYVWQMLHACRKRARKIYGTITKPLPS